MADLKFEVSLGKLKLSNAQAATINTAIQQAVLVELARMDIKQGYTVVPRRPPGWYGIIIDHFRPGVKE